MLNIGTVVLAEDKARAPKTSYEYIMADDDGLLHTGKQVAVSEVLPGDDADICDLYLCGSGSLLKLARNTADNDLVDNEARYLRSLNKGTKPDSTFWHYFPRLFHVVRHEGHAGNVLSFGEGFVSLAAILRAYPKGIDFRDMAWMYKRLLVGVGFAHKQGILHGAILPEHVLVHPTGHGACLVDWSYAIDRELGCITAMCVAREDFYPQEVLRKEPASTALDIYMAAKCMVALLGGDVKTDVLPSSVPEEFRSFLEPCLHEAPRHRPDDAWKLHEEFDGLLKKVVGEPEYRPFKMP